MFPPHFLKRNARAKRKETKKTKGISACTALTHAHTRENNRRKKKKKIIFLFLYFFSFSFVTTSFRLNGTRMCFFLYVFSPPPLLSHLKKIFVFFFEKKIRSEAFYDDLKHARSYYIFPAALRLKGARIYTHSYSQPLLSGYYRWTHTSKKTRPLYLLNYYLFIFLPADLFKKINTENCAFIK